MILPLFDYAGEIWRTCNKTCLKRLDNLQRRGARVILEYKRQLCWYTWYTGLVASIYPTILLHSLYGLQLYIWLSHKLPIPSLFSLIKESFSCNQKRRQITYNQVTTSLFHKSFTHLGDFLYNKLPHTFKEAPNLAISKYRYLTNLKLS